MEASSRRALPRLIEVVEARPERIAAALAQRLADPDPVVRLLAVRTLSELPPGPEIDSVLLDFALDGEERVALLAAGALLSARSRIRRAQLAPKVTMLARSPHARVRALVRASGVMNGPASAVIQTHQVRVRETAPTGAPG